MSLSIPSTNSDPVPGTNAPGLESLGQNARGPGKKPGKSHGMVDFSTLLTSPGTKTAISKAVARLAGLTGAPSVTGGPTQPAEGSIVPTATPIPDAQVVMGGSLPSMGIGLPTGSGDVGTEPVESSGLLAGPTDLSSGAGITDPSVLSGSPVGSQLVASRSARTSQVSLPRQAGAPAASAGSCGPSPVSEDTTPAAVRTPAAAVPGETAAPAQEVGSVAAAASNPAFATLAALNSAKSAEPSDRRNQPSKTVGENKIKNVEITDEEQDTSSQKAVGTHCAKSEAHMLPPESQASFSKNLASLGEAGLGIRATLVQGQNGSGSSPVGTPITVDQATPTTPRGAVQSVLQVVDLQSAKSDVGSTSVNLHFKIGDSNLAVRVEMQAGTVHTQFTTDSSDLRNAIAREWQSVTNPAGSKATQFADPVFASSGEGSSTFGQAPQQGRDQQQAPQAYLQDAASLGLSGKSPLLGDTNPASEDSLVEAGSTGTGQSTRLQTFA